MHYIALLLKQNTELEEKLLKMPLVTKEEVILALKDKWETEREEEQDVAGWQSIFVRHTLNQSFCAPCDIAELKQHIAKTESTLITELGELAYWTEYKEKGQHEHKKQIDLLNKELDDMQTSYDEMAGKSVLF